MPDRWCAKPPRFLNHNPNTHLDSSSEDAKRRLVVYYRDPSLLPVTTDCDCCLRLAYAGQVSTKPRFDNRLTCPILCLVIVLSCKSLMFELS